ncbi:hypothetical protein J7426_18550 [Tropicibacter sp. R16_0]|uniref:hypothetical protein n=1 Tax=Tropicibacter sp. R16_0 TaxID=2821102 RepID=UPI001ADD3B18|nr:hypothetical protein [Tropicibacter sp. R16_0]MBO9452280.1 hypothetical protein [Tropicibacter sp. R16_0]
MTPTQQRTQDAWTLTCHCPALSKADVIAATGATRTTVRRMRARKRDILEAGLALPSTWTEARNLPLPVDDTVEVIDQPSYERACQRRDKQTLRTTITNLFRRTAT